jgi:hypothetical protein
VSVGTLKIARGTIDTTSANHIGFVENGAEWTIKLDANTAIESKNQYVYFDNAFETNTGSITIEYLDGDTALATGLSWQTDADSTDTDVGYGRIYGTPSTEGTNRYKIKYDNNRGDKAEVIVTIQRFPVGTTPLWSSNAIKQSRIIRNLAGDQILADGPTTTYSGAQYTLKDVSGFATGVTPIIDALTGQVKVSNVGDIEQAASTHTFTVVADLGSEIGTFENTFTGSVAYGDAYGARYWGPGNAYGDMNTGPGDYTTSTNEAQKYGRTDIFNPYITSGAVYRQESASSQFDTSPYDPAKSYQGNGGYGLMAYDNTNLPQSTQSNQARGNLNVRYTSRHAATSNGQYHRFLWEVPTGVTSIAVVACGAGAPGMYSYSNGGGGGGGLAWLNDITVTPGEELEIQVGVGRRTESSNSSYYGGDSYVRRTTTVDGRANEYLVYAFGGGYYARQANPASAYMTFRYSAQHNNQRDMGGSAYNTNYGTGAARFGGYTGQRSGAGAAGYQGDGGSNEGQGSGGAGGAGNNYSSTYGGSAGGGVGLDGQGYGGVTATKTNTNSGSGFNGAWNYTSSQNLVAAFAYGGGGGSGGTRGCKGQDPSYGNSWIDNRYINGGMHGGGGGGSGTSWGGGSGAPGGVRIIWGSLEGNPRRFPKYYTTDDPDWTVSTNTDGT